ncbi:leucine-rich repeat-containing protein 61 isoform X3 [Acipenser ruthenus]|uniref:leucine-rich repeat-containing protein 61 isoform X3 n=1 Tax=Acipenser ruthenus TaxID=7906 RepID=UPI0027403620|nr:leucine-rich repeat-containing protein 61 isoform X3 [Acipenser ruthenus]
MRFSLNLGNKLKCSKKKKIRLLIQNIEYSAMDSKKARGQETENYTKITNVLLKSKTGEFDLESILFLKLRGLEAISHCHHLQSLNVAGNLISSIENLQCLLGLRKLENIRLKDCLYNFSNPVCKNVSCRNIILEMFPNIKVVDGERVAGRGSDLYQLYRDIDDSLKGLYKNSSVAEIPDCKPWVEEGYWDLKRSNNAIIDEAYKQFNDVLHECKLLNNRASHVITQTERALSNKNPTKHYVL